LIHLYSKEFLKQREYIPRLDSLVIDEAQDLMSVDVLEVLNTILIGGLGNGEWVMFLDPNQNLFNPSEEYDFTWEYIKQMYKPAIWTLSTNCRNTEQIGRRTSVVALVPPAKHLKISGPKVVMKTFESQVDFQKKIKAELLALTSGGTPIADVVFLSKYRLANSRLADLKTLCSFPIVEPRDIKHFQKKAINYFTVHSFKGLESKVVFIVDVDGFEDIQSRIINYVGMSRAKILLYVFYSNKVSDEYLRVMDQAEKVLV